MKYAQEHGGWKILAQAQVNASEVEEVLWLPSRQPTAGLLPDSFCVDHHATLTGALSSDHSLHFFTMNSLFCRSESDIYCLTASISFDYYDAVLAHMKCCSSVYSCEALPYIYFRVMQRKHKLRPFSNASCTSRGGDGGKA